MSRPFLRQVHLSAALLVHAYGGGEPTGPSSTLIATRLETVGTSSGIAGQPLASTIGVRVLDQFDQPLENVNVTMSVTAGGGSAAPASMKTNASGVPGMRTASGTATVQDLLVQTFTMTVQQPAGATKLVKLQGDNASIPAATTHSLSIAARGANNVRVPKVELTFTVTSGGGYLASFDPLIPVGRTITVTADNGGEAMVSHVMGPSAGGNSVTVRAAGFPPETFHITGTSYASCGGIASYSIGNTVSGTFASGDCVRETNYLNDVYSLSVQTQQIVEFTGDIRFADANRVIGSSVVGATRLILAPGTYYLTSGGLHGGTYTIGSSTVTDIDCQPLGTNFLTRGIDVSLQFASPGCFTARPSIYLLAGQSVTITMSSTTFDAELELVSPGVATKVTDDDGAGGTNARITHTPTLSGQHEIRLLAKDNGRGAYTLRIE